MNGRGGSAVGGRQVRWPIFLASPLVALLAAAGVVLAGIGISSALVVVFVYSFAVMAPLLLFLAIRGLRHSGSD